MRKNIRGEDIWYSIQGVQEKELYINISSEAKMVYDTRGEITSETIDFILETTN